MEIIIPLTFKTELNCITHYLGYELYKCSLLPFFISILISTTHSTYTKGGLQHPKNVRQELRHIREEGSQDVTQQPEHWLAL